MVCVLDEEEGGGGGEREGRGRELFINLIE